MTRTMYDTTNVPATVIPADAEMVAGYVNGLYQSYPAVVQRCPNAVHVSIAVTSRANADVLDIEQGDATPADAPGWVGRQHNRGNAKPTCYCEESQADAVVRALSAAGFIQHVDYELWVASYPSPGHAPNLSRTRHQEAAKQYINHGPHGENYDMSIVFDDAWPHYTSAPPKPIEFSEDDIVAYDDLKRRYTSKLAVDGQRVPASWKHPDTGDLFPFIYDCFSNPDDFPHSGGQTTCINWLHAMPEDPADAGACKVVVWMSGAALADGATPKWIQAIDPAGRSAWKVTGAPCGRVSIASTVPLVAQLERLVVPT